MTLDPTLPSIRWLILSLTCWLLFGNYYAFDNPSALNRQLMDWLDVDYDTHQFHINVLYSVYSFPNMIIPLFIGVLLDKFGTHKLLLILSGLVGMGQGIVALGVQTKQYPLMLFGRIIFGLGGESLTVAQARLVTDWFRGKELALAIGLNLTVARFGTVFNNYFSPLFASKIGISFSVWVGFLSCVISFFCAVLIVIIDLKCDSCSGRKMTPASFHKNKDQSIDSVGVLETLKSTFLIVKTFHPAFILICLICFTYYGALVPFNNIASDFLQYKWYPNDPFTAALVMSIPDTTAIFLVPIIGTIVDKVGYKITLITLGGILMTIGHCLLGSSESSPMFPLLLNGIANSTLLAIWPCIPLLVPEIYWASAYGIITSCINASYAIVPIAVATLVNNDKSFHSVEMFFMLLTLFGTMVSIYLSKINNDHSLMLNSPEKELLSSAKWVKKTDGFLPRVPTFSAPLELLLVVPDIPNIENSVKMESLEEPYRFSRCVSFNGHRSSKGDDFYGQTVGINIPEKFLFLDDIVTAPSSSYHDNHSGQSDFKRKRGNTISTYGDFGSISSFTSHHEHGKNVSNNLFSEGNSSGSISSNFPLISENDNGSQISNETLQNNLETSFYHS